MAAFAAVSSSGVYTANIIERVGLLLADNYPDLLEIVKIADKELKLFKEFVEGLDMRSRMRMSASLQRIPEATKRYHEAFDIYLKSEQAFDLRQETYSLIDTLKKTKEEYLKLDEAIVDSGGNKSEMVGLSDKYSLLKTYLTYYWLDELVITLLGMAGIGKTLLAKKVFEDLDILEWFECRVWVTVGRKYQPEEITESIQAQLDIGAHDMRESLMGKRYFIVLDDVWDLEWVGEYLETSFPDTNNGSRVLVTTRIKHNSFSYYPIEMRLLNKQESWLLLCEKVFSQNSCPPEMEEAGKKIAEKCDGLPLMIITVADLLRNYEMAQWVEISTHKKHQLFIDAY